MRKFSLLLLISTISFAQNLNEFKYAVVPSKFSFSKEPNEFNLNVLTKMFMEKYGFEAHLDSDILTDDFASTNCNKVFVDVIDNSSLFSTKIKVVIKDCKNNILSTSDEGISREKDYKTGYNIALRKAFESFPLVNRHQFATQKSFKTVDEPIFQEELHNEGKPMVLHPKSTTDGIDLVTSNPEVVYMRLNTTSVKDIYIATRKEVHGILFKEVDKWFFEYYKNNQKFKELLLIEHL